MNGKYVLLVEDNPDDVLLAERAFKKCEISDRLVTVWDGEAALDFLFSSGNHNGSEPGHKPALVLLDLKLPRVSGLEVLHKIRADESTQSLPVVVLTSSMEKADQETAYRLGANRFIQKPTDFKEFIEIIRLLKAEWLG